MGMRRALTRWCVARGEGVGRGATRRSGVGRLGPPPPGHCQVDVKLVDRPPRYCAQVCREPAILGTRNGYQLQLDNTLAPNLYYRWSKECLEAGKKRLLGDTTREATSTEVQDLRRENSQLKQVVAAAVLENRALKKIWWSPVRGTIRATDRGREARDHPACGGLGSVGAPYAAGAGGSPVHVLRVVSSLPGRGRGRVGPPAGGRPAPLEPYPAAGPAPRRGGRPGRSGDAPAQRVVANRLHLPVRLSGGAGTTCRPCSTMTRATSWRGRFGRRCRRRTGIVRLRRRVAE